MMFCSGPRAVDDCTHSMLVASSWNRRLTHVHCACKGLHVQGATVVL